MKTFTVATVLSASVALVTAQATYNVTSGTFTCSPGGGAYCAGASLSTNIIIRCTDKVGQPGNCNDNLAGIPPVGVKSFAPCYESSPTAGDAACSFNGTVYPDGGTPFPVPSSPASPSSGTALPSDTGIAPLYPTGGNSSAPAGPIGTGASSPSPTGTSPPLYTGAAIAHKTGSALAAIGLAVAVFL